MAQIETERDKRRRRTRLRQYDATTTGHSEPLPQLRADAQWRFDAFDHAVKVVVLAKFDRQQQKPILPASYHVAGGALVLEYRLLFLQGPGPQDVNIEFSIADLEAYATTVWLITSLYLQRPGALSAAVAIERKKAEEGAAVRLAAPG
ncbi:hypothetical protein N0V88_004616 [Collariella sp. IMI 366227]|nr:hypothetical protein N0V88_004616 [Collariella sp. IMI 366227]